MEPSAQEKMARSGAVPVANFIGFGAGGIGGGSIAASMMSTAAVANGGGVAAGSTVAVLQSVGAVGLATPVGLGLVVAGVAVGGIAIGAKTLLAKGSSVVETDKAAGKEEPTAETDAVESQSSSWVLLEWPLAAVDPVQTRFTSEREAREAYTKSIPVKKTLCRSDMTCVERTQGCPL